jgi:hypothetical protein
MTKGAFVKNKLGVEKSYPISEQEHPRKTTYFSLAMDLSVGYVTQLN